MNTTTAPGSRLPTTIPEYLDQLRAHAFAACGLGGPGR